LSQWYEEALMLVSRLANRKAAFMQRQFVESSMMRTVGYDPKEQILEIEFQSGRIYHYYEVEETVFKELIEAESLGRYFRDNIQDLYAYGQVR
jgi:gluconate kinase